MDIVSHGLWGSIAFGRKNKKLFWLAFLSGIAPDIFSFGLFFVHRLFTGVLDLSGPPDIRLIPSYVYSLYDITHSLVVFAFVFGLVWLYFKKPIWAMAAWGLHILVDIFTHSKEFFPTPFLWPISDYKFSGIPWSDLRIFLPNIALLIIAYSIYYLKSRESKQNQTIPHQS